MEKEGNEHFLHDGYKNEYKDIKCDYKIKPRKPFKYYDALNENWQKKNKSDSELNELVEIETIFT